MTFEIKLSSPLVLILDPIYLTDDLLKYIANFSLNESNPSIISHQINTTFFPYAKHTIGVYEAKNINRDFVKVDVREIIRITKQDFEEYDLSETCIFGVDSARIIVCDFLYLKSILSKDTSLQERLNFINFLEIEQRDYHLITIDAFDFENEFTDFIGDGKYALTDDFIL